MEPQKNKITYDHSSIVTVLKKGNRGSLHPSLNILDSIDCRVTYYKRHKTLFVEYDYDKENDKYRKSIFSPVIENIVSDITQYKQGLNA